MAHRALDTKCLDGFAKACAAHLVQDSRYSRQHPEVAIYGREWVYQSLVNLHFRDEFEHVVAAIKPLLGPAVLKEFEAEAAKRFTPRSDEVFAEELAKRLAITPDGKHIPGKIGNVLVGSRTVATRIAVYEKRSSMRKRLAAFEAGETPPPLEMMSFTKPANWPIYAGEDEERAREGGGVDTPGVTPLPDPRHVFHGDEHMQPVKEG